MYKSIKTVALLFVFALVSCEYDDSSIWENYNSLEERVSSLEDLCNQMNTNINSIQTIVSALEKGDYITNIAPITSGDTEIGYTITFAKSKSITIYHGTNGKDGTTPVIDIVKDSDGIYYWTLNGEWLTDENGKKIKAVGTDGKDGKDGTNGNTPQLKIINSYWYISYDNGTSWKKLDKATGNDGNSITVTQDDEYVYFTLSNGEIISIKKSNNGSNPNIIQFTDIQVKAICLRWDTNSDGELSYKEIAAVTSLNKAFQGSSISIFTEFQYFTGLTAIEYSDFASCYDLATIVLPNSITSIGDHAFIECTQLLKITIPQNVTTIGEGAFSHCKLLTTITIPTKVTTIGAEAFGNNFNLKEFIVEASNNKYASKDGILYSKDMKNLIKCPCKKTQVSIANTVTTIEESAFDQCDLTNVHIPNSVTCIRKWAFKGCTNLNEIHCKATTPPQLESVTFFGDIFSSCKLYVPTNSVDAYKAAEHWKEFTNIIGE
ncbi:MAG: leucine-rich repeat protein [Parabacteroides sp.]|nr:leucine-rich repeat protein [Parabacteroides sp.]